MKMRRKHIGDWISIVMFVAVMGSVLFMAIVSLFVEDRTRSGTENRTLQKYESMTVDSFFSGEWMKNYETYSLDQIVNREWFTTKYFVFLNFVGVIERNGFVLGEENYILPVNKGILWDREELEKQYANWGDDFVGTMEKLNDVVNEVGSELIIVQIPSKGEFCAEKYPQYYEDLEEVSLVREAILDRKLIERDITLVNTRETLKKFESEYVYYLTDHHYTYRGAYYVYNDLLKCINALDNRNLTYPAWDDCEYYISEDRSVGASLRKWGDSGEDYGDYLEYVLPKDMPEYMRYEEGEISEKPLVSKISSSYSSFMCGDCSNTVIKTNREELPSILYVGHSFTNALEMMSIYNFDEMHSIDPRKYEGNLSEYIRNHDLDYIVIVRNELFEGNSNHKITIF